MSWNNNKCCVHSLKGIKVTCHCDCSIFLHFLCLWRGKPCFSSNFSHLSFEGIIIWQVSGFFYGGERPHFIILWFQEVYTIQREATQCVKCFYPSKTETGFEAAPKLGIRNVWSYSKDVSLLVQYNSKPVCYHWYHSNGQRPHLR